MGMNKHCPAPLRPRTITFIQHWRLRSSSQLFLALAQSNISFPPPLMISLSITLQYVTVLLICCLFSFTAFALPSMPIYTVLLLPATLACNRRGPCYSDFLHARYHFLGLRQHGGLRRARNNMADTRHGVIFPRLLHGFKT